MKKAIKHKNGKVKLSDFKPQQSNVNLHNEYGLKVIDDSIRRDGWIGAMTTAADGETFDGSARLEKSADIFGLDVEPIVIDSDGTKPVIIRRTDIKHATDPRAKRLAFIANQSQVIDWNPDAALLAQLAGEDELVKKLAQEDKRLRELLKATNGHGEAPDAQMDKAAELQRKWQVKRGDVWEIGRHRLMCGDSTSTEDVERLMQGEKAELIVTDPPYNLHYGGEGFIADESKLKKGLTSFSSTDYNPTGFLNILNALQFGSIYIYTSKDLLPTYFDFVRSAGMGFNLFVWYKPNTMPLIKNSFLPDLEYAVYGYKKSERVYINGLDYKEYSKCYVSDSSEGRNEADGLHPSVKPVGLIERHIKTSSNVGGIVIDFFLGSGTTLVACEQTGRIGYGMEIEPKYCAVTLQRLSDMGLTPKRIK